MDFAKFASFIPGITFDLKAFDGLAEIKMAKESVGEFVKQEKAEIIVAFDIENGFFGTEEEFFTRLKREVGINRL